jgi:hypothetical protein
MKKCIENLEIGGIIFIKEPYPLKSKTVAEFSQKEQRHLRPKSVYKD